MSIDLSKYGAKVVYTTTSNPLAKYGATLVSTQQPSTIKQWTGIEPKTYLQESLENVKQAVSHPIKTIGSAIGSAGEAIGSSFQRVVKENIDVAKGGKEKFSVRLKDYLEALSADVGFVFSPVSAAFSAAEKIPILKQAADTINIPFTATGKVGEISMSKFVDVLPISKEDKDVLRPAFQEVGTLAGKVLLGGKVIGMIEKGIGIKKSVITEEIKKTKVEAQQVKTILEEKVKVEENKPSESPLIKEARKYKTADEFVNAKVFDKNNPLPTEDMQGFLKTLSEKDKEIAKKLEDIEYKKVGLDRNNGYKPFKISKEENTFYNENIKKYQEKVNKYFSDVGQTKSQLTDIWEKANKVMTTKGISKSAIDINNRLARDGFKALSDEELAKYNPTTIKAEINKVSDLMTDRERIKRILKGEEDIGSSTRQPFFNAVERLAMKTKDVELREYLVKSPIATQRSVAAQELGSAGYNSNNVNPVKVIKEIETAFKEKATKSDKAVKETTIKDKTEIKSETRKLNTKETWSSFIKSIQC